MAPEYWQESYPRGFFVLGVDISEEMISIAKSEFPDTDFIIGDMRILDLDMKFDLVTCTFDSLNYLTSTLEISSVFNRVHEHLNDYGYFLFDVNTPILYENEQQRTIHHSIDGDEFYQILSYNEERMISSTIFQFSDGDIEEHIQKAYSYNEIEKAIEASNFGLIRTFINKELGSPGTNSCKILYLAQKKVERR